MANRTEPLKTRVTPDEKTEIENHLEETNEARSLSDFLRLLALREVRGQEDEPAIDREEIVDAVEVGLSDVTERLDRLEDHVRAIDQNTNIQGELDELARQIYSALPVHDEGEMPTLMEATTSEFRSDLDKAQRVSTPEAWAEYFGEEVTTVRRAFGTVLEYYPDAKFSEVNMGGHVDRGGGKSGEVAITERRYYKTTEGFNRVDS